MAYENNNIKCKKPAHLWTNLWANKRTGTNRDFKEDQALPSIRTLAKDLKISVITTKRAHDDLERDGFIYTIPSKGSYVKGANLDFIKEEYLRLMEKSLRQAKDQAKFAGLDKDQALKAFKFI